MSAAPSGGPRTPCAAHQRACRGMQAPNEPRRMGRLHQDHAQTLEECKKGPAPTSQHGAPVSWRAYARVGHEYMLIRQPYSAESAPSKIKRSGARPLRNRDTCRWASIRLPLVPWGGNGTFLLSSWYGNNIFMLIISFTACYSY